MKQHNKVKVKQNQVYKLETKKSQKFYKKCYALNFNKNQNLLAFGSDNRIQIYYFLEGVMKLLKILNKHEASITTLNFFTNSHFLVSGSKDELLVIWHSSSINSGKYVQKLIGHNGWINCVDVKDQNSNLIVSGSSGKQIKFWSNAVKCLQWNCIQTICEHTDNVYSLSLNPEGKKLISCGKDCSILIIENVALFTWRIKQKIFNNGYGYRLCFLNNETFVYQPRTPEPHNNLQIYQISKESDIYIKTQEILIKGGDQMCCLYFPILYNSNKSLIITKNGHFINFIRIIKNIQNNQKSFLLEQYINFDSENTGGFGLIYGTLSKDGEYLVTWQERIHKIEIRKYQP